MSSYTVGIGIQRAKDIAKAQQAIWEILEEMGKSEEGWSKYVNLFEIELGKSTFSFETAVQGRSSGEILNIRVTDSILGFETLQERLDFYAKYLSIVNEEDLKKVYRRYLRSFIDPNG